MADRTSGREGALNVVLRPGSAAEAAYTSALIAPGFEPEPGLNLQYLGGKTIAHLTYANVYLGWWDADARAALDHALAAAMSDPHLDNVLAQYFAGDDVETTFAGSIAHDGAVPVRVFKDTVETLAAEVYDGGSFRSLDWSTSALCFLLPEGAILVDGYSHDRAPGVDSQHGLGGYHGSIHHRGATVYYAVAVYSEGTNGIVAFLHPWENVCATLYHELQEIRTDADVEDAIRAGNAPNASRHLGWYSPRGGEIGDIPMAEALGDVHRVMRHVRLADGGATVPVQLMWSNAVAGPEGPIARPHEPAQAAGLRS
jgi:hypothetical protein